MSLHTSLIFFFFFFNDTATTEIYTLSLHDALPICQADKAGAGLLAREQLHMAGAEGMADTLDDGGRCHGRGGWIGDRKSTRLNSSHLVISYAVFCLKKKKKNNRR